MEILFIRHATLHIKVGGKNILVDPMLSPAESWEAVRNTPNPRKNPLVDLPMDEEALARLLARLDAVIVTHTHGDHWDEAAREMLAKERPVFCQPQDAEKIAGAGFSDVRPVSKKIKWDGIQLTRTGGRHGTGEIGKLMGPVSGFVIEHPAEGDLYIAGDTIWCPEVEAALQTHHPDTIIVNAGAAQFLTGDPITMTAQDVLKVCQFAPNANVIAVHMEAINHCLMTRKSLRENTGEAPGLLIPENGTKALDT